MIRLGTRGSALALAQARAVAHSADAEIEIVTVESSGAPTEDKSRWTRELDAALAEQRIDIAIHSAKDVAVERPAGIVTAAVPQREDPRDRLVGSGSLADLEPGSRVGTASPRRLALIRSLRQDLDVVELRGNVDTRLRKLADGEADAVVLAAAGLNRLGHGDTGTPLDPAEFVPAAGQGCLLIECREDDELAAQAVSALTDPAASAELAAERSVVAAIGADCHTAFGCNARLEGETIAISAVVLASDGSSWIRDSVEGPATAPVAVAGQLAERLMSVGAADLLAGSRGETG